MYKIKTFDTYLADALRAADMRILHGPAAFGQTPYAKEYDVKKKAAAAFLSNVGADGAVIDQLVRAPLPRGYRTTSRRRIMRLRREGGRLLLANGDGSVPKLDEAEETLEPQSHLGIFKSVETFLNRPRDPLVGAMNHVIVRGTYDEHVLILNVQFMDADIVRAAKRCADYVRNEHPSVVSAWMFHDPRGSRYYLDMERTPGGIKSKKIFGHAAWRQSVNDIQYQVGVFSFSQINLAIVPAFVDAARTLAGVRPEDRLLDLYCGYGLFGASLASQVKNVVAMDLDEDTVGNARYNIGRAGGKALAIASAVTPQSLRKLWDMPRGRGAVESDVVILDPPRTGTAKGVINAIAQGEPRRVVEIFCGHEEIRRSVKEWKTAGYRAERIVPMDLFPGTLGLEVLISFIPERKR